MTELVRYPPGRSLSRKEKRQLERDLAKLDLMAEVTEAALAEKGKVSRYASQTMAETLDKAYRKLRKAAKSGRLTPEERAAFDRLTQEYLNKVLFVVYQTDQALFKRLEREAASLGLPAPHVHLLND